ncbi:MAG: small multi-drug export protein [Ilumatobacteraceae bacterium]
MDVLLACLVVALISFVSGGFAIPIGFALGLEPIEVYIAASLGSMAGLVVFLYAGDKVRARLTRGRPPKEPDADSRIRQLSDRYGAKGLGLIGPIFPGVTASVVIGLSLGLPRASIARWMSIGIAVMFAVYTFGLWALVEIFGVE